MGRQKLKKNFQYEIKWKGLDHKWNTWVPREELLNKGFTKLVQQFDDLESSRDGAGSRETASHLVRKHLEDIGLDGDIAQYNEINGLSGGAVFAIYLCGASRLMISLQGKKSNLSSLLACGTTPRYVLASLGGGEQYS
mgnify:FL=1